MDMVADPEFAGALMDKMLDTRLAMAGRALRRKQASTSTS